MLCLSLVNTFFFFFAVGIKITLHATFLLIFDFNLTAETTSKCTSNKTSIWSDVLKYC